MLSYKNKSIIIIIIIDKFRRHISYGSEVINILPRTVKSRVKIKS